MLYVNVNPIPGSAFTIDTLQYGCDNMVFEIDAVQKGLMEYNWTINKGGMVFNSNSYGDNFQYEVSRPAPGTSAIDLVFLNWFFLGFY